MKFNDACPGGNTMIDGEPEPFKEVVEEDYNPEDDD